MLALVLGAMLATGVLAIFYFVQAGVGDRAFDQYVTNPAVPYDEITTDNDLQKLAYELVENGNRIYPTQQEKARLGAFIDAALVRFESGERKGLEMLVKAEHHLHTLDAPGALPPMDLAVQTRLAAYINERGPSASEVLQAATVFNGLGKGTESLDISRLQVDRFLEQPVNFALLTILAENFTAEQLAEHLDALRELAGHPDAPQPYKDAIATLDRSTESRADKPG